MSPETVVPPDAEETPAVPEAEPDTRPFWEIIAELGESIPREEWDNVPHDGAKNYKHYLYGSPKVD